MREVVGRGRERNGWRGSVVRCVISRREEVRRWGRVRGHVEVGEACGYF